MVLGPLAFLSLLGAPLLLGAALLRALGIVPRTDPIAYAGWAWTTGTLGTAAVVFAWLWTDPDVERAVVPVGAVLLAAGAFFLVGRRFRPETLAPVRQPDVPGWEVWLFRCALAFALAVTAERVLSGSLTAVVLTDEARLWTFRAKLLYHEGGFGPRYEEAARAVELGHADYPLLNPLLQVWTFVHAGRITHAVNRIPIQLFSIALVLCLAGALRRAAPPRVAAVLLLLLPAMDDAAYAAHRAYSDALVALGFLIAIDASLRARADGERAWIGLSSLAVTSLLWSKHEGTEIVCAGLVAFAIARCLGRRASEAVRWRPTRDWLWALPPAAVLALTWSVNARFGAENLFMSNLASGRVAAADREGNFLTLFVENLPERLVPTLSYFAREVFFAPAHSWFVLLVFAVLALASARRIWRGPLRFQTLAIALALGGLIAVFIGLPKDLDYHLDTAATRVAFQVAPAAVLWVAAASTLLFSHGAGKPVGRGLMALYLVSCGLAGVARPMGRFVERAPATLRAAFSRDEAGRIDAALEQIERRRGVEPGLYRGIHAALIAHVPEDAEVLVGVPPDHRQLAAVLRNLAYPRRFHAQPRPPGDIPVERLDAVAGRFWILDLFGLSDQLEGRFERVASGPGWALWR